MKMNDRAMNSKSWTYDPSDKHVESRVWSTTFGKLVRNTLAGDRDFISKELVFERGALAGENCSMITLLIQEEWWKYPDAKQCHLI